MNNEDKYLADKFGRENHFRVPDSYFDNLSGRIFERLAEQAAEGDIPSAHDAEPATDGKHTGVRQMFVHTRWRRWRWRVAAVFVGVAVSTVVWQEMPRTDSHAIQQGPQVEDVVGHIVSNDVSSYFSNSDMQEMVDYTMLDNEDMYAYIAGN